MAWKNSEKKWEQKRENRKVIDEERDERVGGINVPMSEFGGTVLVYQIPVGKSL